MDERVGVTMHKLPFGALLAIDLGLHDFQAGFAIFKNRASSASRRASEPLFSFAGQSLLFTAVHAPTLRVMTDFH
jgi:hypothetical protein